MFRATNEVAMKKKPWEKKNPKPKTKRKPMTKAVKADAQKRAKKAGRPYPNLVDNMAAIKSSKKKKTKGKK